MALDRCYGFLDIVVDGSFAIRRLLLRGVAILKSCATQPLKERIRYLLSFHVQTRCMRHSPSSVCLEEHGWLQVGTWVLSSNDIPPRVSRQSLAHSLGARNVACRISPMPCPPRPLGRIRGTCIFHVTGLLPPLGFWRRPERP